MHAARVTSNSPRPLQKKVPPPPPLPPPAEGSRTLCLHALKIRTDIFIRDWPAFLEAVGGEQGGKECPARLTFVHWFDYSAQVWAGQHFVPTPHDILYMGPIELMEAYTGVGFQSPNSHVYVELWQFDEYCYKRGVSRRKGCHDSDFLYPRLPKMWSCGCTPLCQGPSGTRLVTPRSRTCSAAAASPAPARSPAALPTMMCARRTALEAEMDPARLLASEHNVWPPKLHAARVFRGRRVP